MAAERPGEAKAEEHEADFHVGGEADEGAASQHAAQPRLTGRCDGREGQGSRPPAGY